ncbi:filament-like plant protein 1 isoform X1 [Megalobrama amblycephala]|uniref:filament-like plant protein 1 isoform X1 n=1 Tax=Megalobrama amblycephala TaxID=75352 RepID=UPI002013F52F|nr:filament-like plant protein 1 isoform X1 [Megalobrama amblycephala]
MKIKTMAVLLLVLLLCAGSSIAQDLLSPSVDIIAELEKLKHMDGRIQKLEETLTKVLSENEALKTEVRDSQNKLETVQKESEALKTEVRDSQNKLETVQKESEALKTEVRDSQSKLEAVQKESEALKTEVRDSQNKLETVQKESEALKTLVQDSQSKLESLQKENEALKTEVRDSQNKLETVQKESEALKTLVQDSQNKLESLQKENEGKKVAFSAGLLASGTGQTGPFSDSKTLEYKKVFSNVGNAYDSNTGIFTAPVKGVYYFRFYGHCHGGTTMAISLLKNSQTQCSVHDWKPASNGNASNGVVLTLEIGDQIYTQLWRNTWVYDDPASYTSFSGFLIFPL